MVLRSIKAAALRGGYWGTLTIPAGTTPAYPGTRTDGSMKKEPFDIDDVFRRLRQATATGPKAAMFDLRDRGHDTPFEQLVGSLISARTRDETTLAVCLRLFARARTPDAMAALGERELLEL